VLRNPDSPDAEGQLQEIQDAASAIGQSIHIVNARGLELAQSGHTNRAP
jgi:hypothetical protein